MSLAIEAFVENVRTYCELIESEQHDIVAIRQTLLALMQGVPYLTMNGTEHHGDVEFPRRGHEGWTEDVARLTDLPMQYYRMAYDPLDAANESTVVGDVCDDLADIYGELWHGLQAHDAGAAIYAVKHWRDSYRSHWGQHAVGAVTAIDAYTRQDVG